MSDSEQSGGSWTLLTGHGHVLVEIARNPRVRIRDISVAVGLTERTVQAIVADLEAAGYITRRRSPPGRRRAARRRGLACARRPGGQRILPAAPPARHLTTPRTSREWLHRLNRTLDGPRAQPGGSIDADCRRRAIRRRMHARG